jgi:hypothetical protein
MKLLVFSKPIPDADREPYVTEEEQTIARLCAQGIIEKIYVRSDGSGAVTVVEAPSVDEGLQMLHQLPLVANGCIAIELVPVTEFDATRSVGSSWRGTDSRGPVVEGRPAV